MTSPQLHPPSGPPAVVLKTTRGSSVIPFTCAAEVSLAGARRRRTQIVLSVGWDAASIYSLNPVRLTLSPAANVLLKLDRTNLVWTSEVRSQLPKHLSGRLAVLPAVCLANILLWLRAVQVQSDRHQWYLFRVIKLTSFSSSRGSQPGSVLSRVLRYRIPWT